MCSIVARPLVYAVLTPTWSGVPDHVLLVGACAHSQECLWCEVHVLLVGACTHGQECLWCEVHVLLVGAHTHKCMLHCLLESYLHAIHIHLSHVYIALAGWSNTSQAYPQLHVV